MALCYSGTSDNSKFAVATTETGYDIVDYSQTVNDPKFYKLNVNGGRIGFWSSYDEEVTLSINGEVNGDLDSVPPIQLACTGAITVANLLTMDTVSAGGVYHDTSTLNQSRGPSIATFTTNATRLPNVA